MITPRTLVPLTVSLSLALLSSSCVAKVGNQSSAPMPSSSKSAKDDDKQRQNEHKLQISELKLRIAQMEAKAGEASSENDVAKATLEAEMAASALENFIERVRPLEAASTQLSLDQRQRRVTESQQELDELEAMYAQEEFADLTKELVLSRGRANLEMARRSLELEQSRAAQKLEFDHPRKQRELEEKAAVTAKALDAAKARAERAAIERRVALLQAEHSHDEARRAAEEGDEAES